MVLDPFSIAGAIGLTAGLTSCVVSTIEKAVNQVNTATHAHQRLRGHELALQTCQQRLEAWAWQWYKNDEVERGELGDEELQFLWGHNGFEQVESTKSAILEEQRDLNRLLYGHNWASGHGLGQEELREGSQWQSYVANAETAISGNCNPLIIHRNFSGSFLRRMQTALYNENLLGTNVTRLERRVDNLERLSCMHFYTAQQRPGSHYAQPSREEIGAVILQKRRMRHLFHDLIDAYEDLNEHRPDLSFTPFVDTEACQLGTQHELTVTFLSAISSESQEGYQFYRSLATTCNLDGVQATHIRSRARQILEQNPMAQELAILEEDTIRRDFTYISGLSERDQALNREKIRPDCMAIALCISAWSMLTWNTLWLKGLSSCKIVPARFEDGRSLLAFSPSYCVHDQCSCSSRQRTWTNRPFLLLAVVLAELALACPISVRNLAGTIHFRKQSIGNNGLYVEHIRSEWELLDEIIDATSHFYRSAVKFCLREDRSSHARSGNQSTSNHTRFYTKVVKPLDRHYQELRKHAERHSKVYDSFGQHAARYANFPQVHG